MLALPYQEITSFRRLHRTCLDFGDIGVLGSVQRKFKLLNRKPFTWGTMTGEAFDSGYERLILEILG